MTACTNCWQFFMKMTMDINEDQQAMRGSTAVRLLLGGIFLLIMISIFILSWVPPVSRDALTHHLTIPKLYLQHGGIFEIPSILFSYYPMNLDLLYMIPLYFGNDIAPKFIHFTFALLTAWLIYGYLIKRLGIGWAMFGAIFFLSLPIIVKLSITVYVVLGLIFFSTASLMSLLKWFNNHFQLKFLILTAVWCGLALGTKYNGFVVLLILTLFIPFVYIRISKTGSHSKQLSEKGSLSRIQLQAVGVTIIFFSIALLVFSPWMIRNYIWKSNPIYPLYDQIFNRDRPPVPDSPMDQQGLGSDTGTQAASKAKPTRWSSFAMRSVIYGESWWEIALIPVRIFFQGQDNNPKYFDGKLTPFLLLLPLFAFFKNAGHSATLHVEKKIFLFFVLLFVLYTFFATSIRIRYIAPILPPLVILSTFGFRNLVSALTKRWENLPKGFSNVCMAFIAGALFAYNGAYIVQQFNYVQPFSYLSGQLDRDAYIVKYRPEYSIYQYANRHLPDSSKILGLYLGNRRYYCDRKLIFGQKAFQESIQRAQSLEELIKGLQMDGYTHLMIRFDLFNQYINKQFDERQKQMLQAFFKAHLRAVSSKNGYGLFELI
jgi:4-amino-4-deoxy-L-arabinose transferase-like glycosyltransferase